jgi:hypothetical protein
VFWKGHVAVLLDADTIIHANAFHMAVAIEPLAERSPASRRRARERRWDIGASRPSPSRRGIRDKIRDKN